MKKIAIFIFSIMIFIGVSAFADAPAEISLQQSSEDDEKIFVQISISENSRFCGGSFNLVYDNEKIYPASYRQEELLDDYSCFVNLYYKENTLRFSWAGIKELHENGNLFTVCFKPLSNEFETVLSLDSVKLADIDGNRIDINTNDCNITYKSSNKSAGHSGNTSSSKFQLKNEINVVENNNIVFTDVKENDWFATNVKYVFENGLMNGTTETEFAPNDNLTRAMLVAILYRAEGEPKTNKSIPFADVTADSYYANAVIWAHRNGIVSGVTENEFAPDENITREQIATIIYRYAKFKGYDTSAKADISAYADCDEIFEYATEAMQYAVGSGLIKGKTETTLTPKDNATRAEIAAILQRFIEGNK